MVFMLFSSRALFWSKKARLNTPFLKAPLSAHPDDAPSRAVWRALVRSGRAGKISGFLGSPVQSYAKYVVSWCYFIRPNCFTPFPPLCQDFSAVAPGKFRAAPTFFALSKAGKILGRSLFQFPRLDF
jgi:hypothetical protein